MFESAAVSGTIILLSLILWLVSHQIHERRARAALAAIPLEPRLPSLLYLMRDSNVPCAAQERHLRNLEEASGVRVRRINVDCNRDMAVRFGVSTVPATLILDQGGIIKYANYGVTDMTRLIQQLERPR
jgi:hypothetical protein